MITPDNPYYRQVQLLVRVLPAIAAEGCFALKGGTAINLFVRDLPRLSVDIDLAFLPITEFDVARRQISEALGRVAQAEHEIRRKACKIAFYLLVEALRRYPVQRGEVGVDHNLMPADDENLPGDARGDEERGRFGLLHDAALFHTGNNDPDVRRVDYAMLAFAR